MRWLSLLLWVSLAAGCGDESKPMIEQMSPLNGSTAVDVSMVLEVLVASGGSIEAENRKVVLYDVTAGAQITVAANVEIYGPQLQYEPQDLLAQDHDYELVMEQGFVNGDGVDEVDASEWPDEPISWPLKLRFSTAQRPRVRGAYLENAASAQRIFVLFSQAMDPVASSNEVEVLDLAGNVISAQQPVWVDARKLRLDLLQFLDPAAPYTLKVKSGARSETNIQLDGNDNGVLDAEDDFSASFTGSQLIIRSRLL